MIFQIIVFTIRFWYLKKLFRRIQGTCLKILFYTVKQGKVINFAKSYSRKWKKQGFHYLSCHIQDTVTSY